MKKLRDAFLNFSQTTLECHRSIG